MRALAILILLAASSIAHADAPPRCVALAACEQACSATNTFACTEAARFHFEGRGVPVDSVKSFRLASTACRAGDGVGCALVGYHHQDGLGTSWSPKLAVAAYERACKAGAGIGCYNLASMYYGAHGVDQDNARADELMKLARTHWETACKADAPSWCTNLGYLVVTNDGDQLGAQRLHARACAYGDPVGCVEVLRISWNLDLIKPVPFLRELEKLCERGTATACSLAASLLHTGEKSIAKDARRAVALSERGCVAGDKHSCVVMAMQHVKGDVVARDHDAASSYFEKACDRALADACFAIAQAAISAKATTRALSYARRACHMGHAKGCAYVGLAYLGGEGVTKNEREALKWVGEACRMGGTEACVILVRRDLDLRVPREVKQRLYTEACNSGLASACKRLAKL